MVLSYYLYKYPYKITWYILNFFNKTKEIAVYVADPLDYIILKNITQHFQNITYIVKNKKSAQFLSDNGIKTSRMPVYPKTIIMSRHAAHKFPSEKIIKFGFRHGAYHFKAFTKAKNYNAFNAFFVTSPKEVELAKQKSIHSTISIGFPKLDNAFNGYYTDTKLNEYKKDASINESKKTIIFTSTWDKSGMSAIDQWIDQIEKLKDDYNILVTLHPWMSKQYVDAISNMEGIYFIKSPDILPFLMISDVMVADTSSIIAEFCALNKPIITLKTVKGNRSLDEIEQLLDKISLRIKSSDELEAAIENCIQYPQKKEKERLEANILIFDDLDGKASERAVMEMKKRIDQQN
jgi:CDP-glycerol glycerophosphotransferase (TagB/SpsB family)